MTSPASCRISQNLFVHKTCSLFRGNRFFLVVLLFILSGYPSPAGAETIQPENFKQLSHLYTYNDEAPYISGNLVVWGAKPAIMGTTRHIMLYDLAKDQEIQITNNNFENASPAAEGDLNLVVYKSTRNGLHGIYLCEYNPANGSCPEVKISEDANYKYWVEIDGNRIVWVESSTALPYRKIYACDYDFAGHCPKQSVAGGDSVSRPNLEGNLLLWEDRTAYDGGTLTEHLFLRDFATGNTYDLDKGDNEVSNMAALDGNKIFWAKQKYNTALQRWERVMVRCDYAPQNASSVCPMQEVDTTMGKTTLFAPSSPSISGKRIVYRNDLRNDPGQTYSNNADMYHYNLETGEILRVTTEPASQHMPMVSGNRAVWREVAVNNTLLVRLYEFKMPNNPPVLTSVGSKSVDDGALLQFPVLGTDVDNDSLSFTHPLAQDLPSGASFNTTLNQAGRLEGTFSWTPPASQAGDHFVLFEVSDGKLYASEMVTVRVAKRLYCGDGIINGTEQCDGTAGVGAHQACLSACTLTNLPYCGDGILNGAEQCDGTAGVGQHQECLTTCTLANLPYCGDGIKNGTEQCDGSAGVGLHQECSTSCALVNLPYCGDGLKNGAEACDGTSGAGLHQECSTDCKLVNLPYCGDGTINGTEQCDGTAGIGQHQECSMTCGLVNLPYCGDGIVNGSEQCDGTAGTADGKICSSSCAIVEQELTICHRPPGNTENAQTIKTSPNALQAHLGHGDTMGACVAQKSEKEKAEENYLKVKDNYEKVRSDHYNVMQLQKQQGLEKIMNEYQAKLLKEEDSYRKIEDHLASALRGQNKASYPKALNEYKAKLAKEDQNYRQRKNHISRAMRAQKNEYSQKALNEYKGKMAKEEEIFRKARNEYNRVMQAKKK